MGLNNPRPGYSSAAEYSVPGLPWLTSSILSVGETKKFDFERVSKWVLIKNNTYGTTANVGVTLNGAKSTNYFTLIGGESVELDWRVARLFVSASVGLPDVSIIAGLTMIDNTEILQSLTGSEGWKGVG